MLVRVFPLAFYHFSYVPIAHFLWYVEIPDPTLLKPLFPATRGGKFLGMLKPTLVDSKPRKLLGLQGARRKAKAPP